MNHPELPPDLTEMELQLRQRPQQEPAADFRQRVLAAVERTVNEDLSRTPPHPSQPEAVWGSRKRSSSPKPLRAGRCGEGFWQFAAATAAAVLLAINVSMSAANNTDGQLAAAINSEGVERTAEQIQLLAPEMSGREARRQGLLLQARARSVPAPHVRPPDSRFVR